MPTLRPLGVDATYTITWEDVGIMIVVEFRPIEKDLRMGKEPHSLTIDETSLSAYIRRFKDLTTIYLELMNSEDQKIKKYVEGQTSSL